MPEKTKNVETVTIGSLNFSRNTAAPGWQWSEDVILIVKTESCQVNHLIYVISGKVHTRMDVGSEMEFSTGILGQSLLGITVGEKPAVWIELSH